MAKYLHCKFSSSLIYPYYNDSSSYSNYYITATITEGYMQFMPYIFGDYFIDGQPGVLEQRMTPSYYGIANLTPSNFPACYTGVQKNYRNETKDFTAVVGMLKFEGDIEYDYGMSTYTRYGAYYTPNEEEYEKYIVDGIDVSNRSFRPINAIATYTLATVEQVYFDTSTSGIYTFGYFVDAKGVYGDFPFVGIIVEPNTNELYFIKEYPNIAPVANDSVDLPGELNSPGLMLENILYVLGDENYLKVSLDSDELQELTFDSNQEIQANFYSWLTYNFNEVFTGHYVFWDVNENLIADLNEKPPITHYAFNTGEMNTLTLTYSNGLQDVITWTATTKSGYSLVGFIDIYNVTVFKAGEDTDCNVSGYNAYFESFEKANEPTNKFGINLYYNYTDEKTIYKKLALQLSLEGALKSETNLINPVIMVTLNETDVNTILTLCNYCYIPLFKRYYFIRNITMYRTNVYILELHVDVLETFKKAFENGNSNCRVVRSETNGNDYLVDSETDVTNRSDVTLYEVNETPVLDDVDTSQDFIRLTQNNNEVDPLGWLITVLGRN